MADAAGAESKAKRRKSAPGKGAASKAAEEKVPAPEIVYVGSGPLLEGAVSAWYDGDGLTGENYGFVERLIRSGAKSVGVMEHHHFTKADATSRCLADLRKGLRVQFRCAGRDVLGRWRGVEVDLASGRGADHKTPAGQLGLSSSSKRDKQATVVAEAAAPAAAESLTVAEITHELVLKAWRKLGGEATWREIVAKIKTDKKLAERAAAQLGSARENSGDEVWEELVPKILKAEGEWTQEKRAADDHPPAKVFRLREG